MFPWAEVEALTLASRGRDRMIVREKRRLFRVAYNESLPLAVQGEDHLVVWHREGQKGVTFQGTFILSTDLVVTAL